MLANTFNFLIRNLSEFFILLLLARFFLQAARIPFKHPLTQFVLSLTNWAVIPVRRILPPFRGLDSASLMLAWLVALLMHAVLLALSPWPFDFTAPFSLFSLALAALLEICKMSLYLLFATVIGQALMSWLAPYNPLMPILTALTAPFLRPLHRFIPPIGGVDITPLVLILAIQLVLNVIVPSLEQIILQGVSMIMLK
ncbi:YggT family protein [Iodobacter fluviatilis]|uniref:YGGT family n=1 Tax=Iodobacter fluviatilis TaxID=537 RepID=A0A377Q2R9_9NEIS|nr:YggT family protein [Iodobacter fluviatilis]TCU90090.1 YggT family protein [Iodobacter fluviatilis]STQ89117.1 YGGT family [Iodobacter fluviatilis]